MMKGKTIKEVCSRKSVCSHCKFDIFQVLISLIFIPRKLTNNHSAQIYKYRSFEVFGTWNFTFEVESDFSKNARSP